MSASTIDPVLNGKVRLALEQLVAEGVECGVQVAVYRAGKLVVDTWAGTAAHDPETPVGSETLFPIFSSAKVGAITSIHKLVERGLVSYDTRVAEYWPEFAAEGKDKATVRHILTHSVGIPYLPEGVTVERLCDYEFMTRSLAAMKPVWEPGTKTGYHAQNFHWLAGETIRRISGRFVTEFVREEIRVPLGLDGFYIGIEDDALPRISSAHEHAASTRASTEGGVVDLMDRANGPEVWRSIFRGIANARSVARIYAALGAGGTLDGVRLLAPETVHEATQLQTDAWDEIRRMPVRKGLGYRLGEGGTDTSFGHTGGGGNLGFADPALDMSYAYVKNLHGGKRLSPEKQAISGTTNPAHYVAHLLREAIVGEG